MFNIDDIQRYIEKYRPEGIIIDTNILILFLIGNFDKTCICNCKTLNDNRKKYSTDDFELLSKIISYFHKIIITPQIIAEISNLTITKGFFGSKLNSYVSKVISFLRLENTHEKYQPICSLWNTDVGVLSNFGLTDITMFELAKNNNMPIVTDDFPFYSYCFSNKIPIIKFEHIKNSGYKNIFNN